MTNAIYKMIYPITSLIKDSYYCNRHRHKCLKPVKTQEKKKSKGNELKCF